MSTYEKPRGFVFFFFLPLLSFGAAQVMEDELCPFTQFRPSSGAPCESCPQNMMWNNNVNMCLCEKGFYLHKHECIQCAPGKISTESGDSCTTCNPQTYAARSGQSVCDSCWDVPTGIHCPETGPTSYYILPAPGTCESEHTRPLLPSESFTLHKIYSDTR